VQNYKGSAVLLYDQTKSIHSDISFTVF